MGCLLCVLSQALLSGQRTDHLFRCPGGLLKGIEEDAAGSQDRNTSWDHEGPRVGLKLSTPLDEVF